MSDQPKLEPGQIVGMDHTPGYRNTPSPIRVVPRDQVMYALDLIKEGALTLEQAMRILYPEEAGRMFNLDHNRNR